MKKIFFFNFFLFSVTFCTLSTSEDTEEDDIKGQEHLIFPYEFTVLDFFQNARMSLLPYKDIKDKLPPEVSGYAPKRITCPKSGLPHVEKPAKISQEEQEYMKARRPKVNEALLKFFKKTIGDESLIDLEDFIENKPLTIGLSFSGGGYKAFFTGAGQLLGLDDRFGNESLLSGILQASSYISGINEANWLIGALIAHGFPVVSKLFDSDSIFNFNNGLDFPFGDDISQNQKYVDEIGKSITDKFNNGFPVSKVDVLGRALSYQLLGEEKDKEWAHFTLSDVANLDTFKRAEMPYPLLMSRFEHDNVKRKRRRPFTLEMSPYRITSWDNFLHGSVSTANFGSYKTLDEDVCVENLDNLGFLMGATNSEAIQYVEKLTDSLQYFNSEYIFQGPRLEFFHREANAYLFYDNNPLFTKDLDFPPRINSGVNHFSRNIALEPYSQSQRVVDVVFLFDNTEDADGLPYFEKLRAANWYLPATGGFLPMPSLHNWVKDHIFKLGTPLFFGCDAVHTPLYIYIPNGRYVENITIPSQSQVMFSDEEIDLLVRNGYAGVSLDNEERRDDDWGTCVACVMINHNLLKQNMTGHNGTSRLPEKCHECMDKYCVYEIPRTTTQMKKVDVDMDVDVESSRGFFEKIKCHFAGC